MTFPLEHWNNPRERIAGYSGNDMGYVTHGALQVALLLRALDILPSAAAAASMLDFGCGTARIARILAKHFGRVEAYDPSPECLHEAHLEMKRCKPINFHNLTIRQHWAEVRGPFDYVTAISVFEHLSPAQQDEGFAQIAGALNPGGRAALWLHTSVNLRLIERLKLTPPVMSRTIGLYVWTKG
jgi:cyclopropane fatty-acyl-phospholipid synthase-like methyltransferase